MFRAKQYIKNKCNTDSEIHSLSLEELKSLQIHLFKMYKDIEKICIRHKLNLTLAAGNVIGAIRHGGWIPWDDDLDIAMPREDYDKFIDTYSFELPDNYVVYAINNDNGPINRFCKIIDKNSIFSTYTDIGPKHIEGIFIDIFPYDNIPSIKLVHKIKKIIAYGLMFVQNSVNQYCYPKEGYKNALTSSTYGKRVFQIRQCVGRVCKIIKLSDWYRILDKLIRNKHLSEFVYCGVSTSTGWVPIAKSTLFPARRFTFPNGESAFIPNEPEKFLDHVYGDWKTIPNDEDKWHHYVKDFKLPE